MFLILKNIFKIKIHLFFYVFMFVSLVTGNFRDYIIFTSIIVVHEIGHIFGGFLFSWNIEKIIILPFGGLTIFKQFLNTSLFEQFIVTLLGPLFQIIFYLFLNYFFDLSNSVVYYNYVLLFFNLLPIYPLDGSKFLYVFLCFLFPFKVSHLILVYISFLFTFLVFLLIGRFDFLVYLIMLFLIIKNFNEYKNHDVIFNKFLLERYIYDFNFSGFKIVRRCNKMYLWCRHVFLLDNRYILEKKYLSKMFDKHSHL